MTKNNRTIQEKIAELDNVVSWFDSEDFTLERALEQFATAKKIASEIEDDLTQIKNNINVVKQKFDSELSDS